MATFTELRQKYPEYNDLSDDQFVQGFYKKFYSDLPYDDFAKKIQYTKGVKKTPEGADYWDKAPAPISALAGAAEAGAGLVSGAASALNVKVGS